ncbi:hypothetical protein [Yersinia pseudotuberculosis]|uniref:hypothetical protein n=1 Tax=Yersinia pseudotuberculosis TaxID=633 RepID=UPI0005E557E8|nr:hypothetical protein [Yersinia pseudotuberculosis]CNB77761.1 Uncharacterised protein [Yersinia pseudotuberculosis]
MYGLDNTSGISVMPPVAPAVSPTPLWFTEGGAGQSPSYPGQDWFNQVQAELLNILKAADLTPEKGKVNQLASAISVLASAYAISIVNSTGQSLTSAMSQKAVTDFLSKKMSKEENGADIPDKDRFIENLGLGEAAKSGVAQVTGTSETNVMSQKSVTDLANGKVSSALITIPGGTDIQTYFIGRDSGIYGAGGNVINSPDPTAWCDYFWLKHGDKYGRLMCYISNNKVATNTLHNGVWSGWISLSTLPDVSSAIASAPLFGIGQTYRILSGMNLNAVHTHTGSRPIFVSIVFNNENNQERSIEVDGVTVILITPTTSSDQPGGVTFIVPPGSWYRVNTNTTIRSWVVLQ